MLYKRRPYIYRGNIRIILQELETNIKSIGLEINTIRKLNTIKKLKYIFIYMLTELILIFPKIYWSKVRFEHRTWEQFNPLQIILTVKPDDLVN